MRLVISHYREYGYAEDSAHFPERLLENLRVVFKRRVPDHVIRGVTGENHKINVLLG
jgi:hypothetical protein